MSILGIIGGTNADFDFTWAEDLRVETPYGQVEVATGVVPGGPEVRFVRRHGCGHALLSSMVQHRASVWALNELGCSAVLGTTVCGVLDPGQSLGSALIFDDLYFPDNRLPDGSPCTFFDEPGQPGRGHYIFASPLAAAMRSALLESARRAELAVRDGGTYAYSLGPRFNTRSEIAVMRAAGACAVSQTAGPEAVLAGELELPYALLGFGVDYANGVQVEPTPIEALDANIAASKPAFETIVRGACAALADCAFEGFVYRFE